VLTGLTVRERTEADIAACVEALRGVYAADRYPMRWPADAAAFVTARDVLAAWVARREGAVVGHVVLRSGAGHDDAAMWSAATGLPDSGHGLIARLFVVPEERGTGLGRQLLDIAVAESWHRALWPVLDVMAANTAAVALYERLGWRRVGGREFPFSDGSTAPMYCYVAPPDPSLR